MPDVTSLPFRFRALPVTAAAWGAIPAFDGREGVTTTYDVSGYFTDGDPTTTDFSVTAYSDSAGTTTLSGSHVLAGTFSIVDSTQIITMDLTSVNISANTDIYLRVTAHQPDA